MDLLDGRKFSILLKSRQKACCTTFLGVASMNLKELCFICIYFSFLYIVALIMKSIKVHTLDTI